MFTMLNQFVNKFTRKQFENGIDKGYKILALGKMEGRVCPSIEFEFISAIIGQDFSVPIKPITRLKLKENSSS